MDPDRLEDIFSDLKNDLDKWKFLKFLITYILILFDFFWFWIDWIGDYCDNYDHIKMYYVNLNLKKYIWLNIN